MNTKNLLRYPLLSLSVAVLVSAEQPVVNRILFDQSTVEMHVAVDPGKAYDLNASESLQTWETIGSFVTDASEETVVATRTGQSKEFFQVVEAAASLPRFFAGTVSEVPMPADYLALGCLSGQDAFYYLTESNSKLNRTSPTGTTQSVVLSKAVGSLDICYIKTPSSDRFAAFETNPDKIIIIQSSGTVIEKDLSSIIPTKWDLLTGEAVSFPDGIVVPLEPVGLSTDPAEYAFAVFDWTGALIRILTIPVLDHSGQYFDFNTYYNTFDRVVLLGSYLYVGGGLAYNFNHPTSSESGAVILRLNLSNNSIDTFTVLDNGNDREKIDLLFMLGSGLGCQGSQSTTSSTDGKDHAADPFWAKVGLSGVVNWIQYKGFENDDNLYDRSQFLSLSNGTAIIINSNNSLVMTIDSGGSIGVEAVHMGRPVFYRILNSSDSVIWIWHEWREASVFRLKRG
ncbi:hypothetical protein G0Q06_01285 [Puniceicoccales bacterium CK1056]|uniref:Uncharacterized protein n=1 Tax=Oceanipulchritudo coccoides TaxID=2706888 RepID=A0A6B2LZZ8_9BACT|nr:hypothetical protein [Oceanipulchritudo coccoides]NDV61075.1 hypothetical protein [Oceanipulchritudo coccoides]